MAVGGVFSSSVGFLEVVVIILIIREVIRLIGGGSGSSSSGSSGNGGESGWDMIKKKWDNHIEKGNQKRAEKEKELEKIDATLMNYAVDGKNALEQLVNGSTRLNAEISKKEEIPTKAEGLSKGLITPMIVQAKKLKDDFNNERKLEEGDLKLLQEIQKGLEDDKKTVSDLLIAKLDPELSKEHKDKLTAMQTEISLMYNDLVNTFSDEKKIKQFIEKYGDDITKLLTDIKGNLDKLPSMKGNPKKVNLVNNIVSDAGKLSVIITTLNREYPNYLYTLAKIRGRNTKAKKANTDLKAIETAYKVVPPVKKK